MKRLVLLVFAIFTEVTLGSYYSNTNLGTPKFLATITYQETAKDVPTVTCIGTIITEAKVVTSCRCLWSVSKDRNRIRLIAGTVSPYWNDEKPISSMSRQIRTPKSWQNHEACGQGATLPTGMWEKDYTLVTLNYQFIFNKVINGALYLTQNKEELETRQNFYKNNDHRFCKACYVSGYTTTDFKNNRYNQFSTQMITQEVETISDDLCIRMYCGERRNCLDKSILFKSGFICARVRDPSFKICDGDRGSPLVCQGLVYGYYIGTDDCENAEKPMLFLEQSEVVSFINYKVLKSSGIKITLPCYLPVLLVVLLKFLPIN